MTELSLENIEFIKILAISDATILQAGMNDATRHRLDDEIGTILREYYRENTMNTQTEWTQKLTDAGIDEDAGKAAIACARRLGIDIS
jgi:lysophospholipase L1-like esterase